MARVRSAETKTRIVAPKNIVDSRELDVAPEGGISITEHGKRTTIESDIETEGNVYGLNDKAKKLAFLEEPVTIIIAEGTEKNPEQYVFLSVNGVGAGPNGIPWVPRNVEITIKRKYLSVLANARPVRFRKQERYEQSSGERVVDTVGSSSDRYPFQVVEDRNPLGRDWLRQLRLTKRAG